MFHGAIVDIADGWSLCDGTRGTPDLTDNFIIGAGNNYSVNDSAGQAQHSHGISLDRSDMQAGDDIPHSYPTGDYESETQLHYHGQQTHMSGSLPKYYALAYIMRLT